MSMDTWNSLPPDIQKALDEASGLEKALDCGRIFDEENAHFLQEIIKHDEKVGNPPVYYLPDDERARWKEAVAPVIEEWVAEKEAAGLPAKAALDELQALVEKYSK